MKPKSFALILSSMIEAQLYSASVKDLHAGSAMRGLLDQLHNTPEYKLKKLLAKLDNRFKRFL